MKTKTKISDSFVYKALKTKSISKMLVYKQDKMVLDMLDPLIRTSFTNNVQVFSNLFYVTKPFTEALCVSLEKLFPLYKTHQRGDIRKVDFNGTLCFGGLAIMCCDECLFGFYEEHLVFFLHYESMACYQNSYYKHESGQDNLYMVADIYTFFLNNCDVSTKIINKGEKLIDVHCKYTNDTDIPIKALSSTWFTNIVRSEGFKVRGHFRWQPHGKGLEKRKLIYVADFAKHGYTRRADKLLQ